jgi:hypothetical protein
MAQQVVTKLVDDITGKEIPDGEGETIQFAFNGVSYEIDLDTKNAKKFTDAITFYIDHGRRLGKVATSAPARRGGSRTSAAEVDNNAVRAWAAENGYDVSPRGRIKGEIIEAYRAAMG